MAMFNKWISFTVSLTHEPTGITLYADSQCFRNEREAYNSLLSRMRSRLYMLDQINIKPDDLNVEYYNPVGEDND